MCTENGSLVDFAGGDDAVPLGDSGQRVVSGARGISLPKSELTPDYDGTEEESNLWWTTMSTAFCMPSNDGIQLRAFRECGPSYERAIEGDDGAMSFDDFVQDCIGYGETVDEETKQAFTASEWEENIMNHNSSDTAGGDE